MESLPPLSSAKYVTEACMGETAVRHNVVAADKAEQRQQGRVVESLMNAARYAQRADTQQRTVNMQQFLQTLQNGTPIQRFTATILQPIVQLAAFVQRFAQQAQQANNQFIQFAGKFMQQSSTMVNNLVSGALSFFFGFKKEKTEEKEQREKNELAFVDVYDERHVEESAESGLNK